MKNTYQAKDLTIWQHGEQVWQETQRIIANQNSDLPQWFLDNHPTIINKVLHPNIIKTYTKYHDVGKCFCLEVDKDGKRHFPNHAEISKNKFLEYFPDKPIEAELIGLDMLFHTKSYNEIMDLSLSEETLFTLLLVSFAEIFANKEMFGDISFKIKYKKLDRIGKRLIKNIIDKGLYSYILVRDDLINGSHKAVQACHAIYESAMREKEHESLVLCKVKDLNKLKAVINQLTDAGIKTYHFQDSIYNNEITAIATEPVNNEQRKLFKKYKLLNI